MYRISLMLLHMYLYYKILGSSMAYDNRGSKALRLHTYKRQQLHLAVRWEN